MGDFGNPARFLRSELQALLPGRLALANFKNRSGADRFVAERIEQAHPIPPSILGNERVARMNPLGWDGGATRCGAAKIRRAGVIP